MADGAPVSDWDDAEESCCDVAAELAGEVPAGETTVGSGCVRAALK